MIKKLLLLLIIFLFSGITIAMSQCTPDSQYTTPGVHPDSIAGLPHAQAGVNYSTVVTVNVPSDTTVNGMLLPIDSIGILSITGLPSGFTYTPNSVSGFWPGGSSGCVSITGINDTAGTWPLIIQAMGHVASFTSVQITITYFKIVIDSALGIQKNTNNGFEVFQNSPNPFVNTTEISFSSDANATYNVEVFNMIGKVIYTDVVKATRGINKFIFSASDLPQGIYFYKISNGTHTSTRRMIVSSR